VWYFSNAHFFGLLVEMQNLHPCFKGEKEPREAEHHKKAGKELFKE
jgi:hypothetical protein